MDRINERYNYLAPVIPLYRNKADEILTIDSNEVYDKILFEVFGNSYLREAEIKIFVKPANSHANTSVFGRMIRKGRRALTKRINAVFVELGSLCRRPTTLWYLQSAQDACLVPEIASSKLGALSTQHSGLQTTRHRHSAICF